MTLSNYPKAKEEFRKWLFAKDNPINTKRIDYVEGRNYGFGCGYDGCESDVTASDVFEELPFEMQYGVYLKFLWSIDIKPFGLVHPDNFNIAIDKAFELLEQRLTK